ncbi:DNA starvation/stationary phase protection protein [Streptomyces tremellae]|uniref:DNA starvation/stationary phase protection protein n=1 Tax=Streptomyces tremellae TaxID=1124239 RepID=A0ABP7EWL2_9ACTN
MTSDTVSRTARLSEQDAAVGFTASRQLAESLQAVLVDLVELHLQGKQAHWNLVGHNFRDLHKQLDHIVDYARDAGDTIAERMRSLHAVPDGRSDTVVATTTLPAFPEGELSVAAVVDLVTTRLHAATATLRRVHDGVDAEDPSTADLLHGIIDKLEQYAWMVSSENREV